MRDEKGQFIKGHEKLGGREKGTSPKIKKEIKDMIFEAFENAGGVEYLVQQSQENPVAFLGLLKCIVPKIINANIDMNVNVAEELDRLKNRVKDSITTEYKVIKDDGQSNPGKRLN